MYQMRLIIFLFWQVFSLASPLLAQKKIGVAKIVNISHFDMNAGTQNWQLQQDSAGTIYVANNNGLITYNGKEWKSYPIPNHTIIRSLRIVQQDRIYIGGQGMFGFFTPSASGLTYFDLTKLIPKEHQDFGDTWRIVQFKKDIFFQTSKYIFRYDGNTIKVIQAKKGLDWTFLDKVNDRLFIADNHQLFEWKEDEFISIRQGINAYITDLTDLGSAGILVSLLTEKPFVIIGQSSADFNLSQEIVNQQVNTISKLENGQFAIGTVSNGLYIVDKDWKIVQNLNSSDGLRNNTILSSLVDKNARLWLGLDNGIAIIDANSAIRNIYPVGQVPIASYTSMIYQNRLFIGTTDGVYATTINPINGDISYSSNTFQKMPNTKGQVWNFEVIDQKLFMLHHTGTFQYDDGGFIKKSNIGSWLVQGLNQQRKLFGTYNGLFETKEDFKDWTSMGNTEESMRFMELDPDGRHVWTSHPYRGVYRYDLQNPTATAELFGAIQGLPSNNNNYVYKIGEELVFTGNDGIFRFDPKKKRFYRDEEWNRLFGNAPILYLKADRYRRIWFVSNERLGVLELSNKKITYFPELEKNMIGGFYHINPYDSKNILVGSYNGLFHINYEVYRSRKDQPNISFNKITASNQLVDSLLMNGYFNKKLNETKIQDRVISLDPAFNSIILDICNHDAQNEDMYYAYRIKDQGDWSNWSKESTRTFGNLEPGQYTLEVKAKNRYEQESEILSFQVIIEKHWYQKSWAVFIYFLIGISILYIGFRMYKKQLEKQHKRFEKKQRELTYIHELESRDKEHKITALEKEKLQTEIVYKNKELASITMNIFRRSRLMDRMKTEMEEVISSIDNKQTKNEVEKIVKKLVDQSKQRDDWEQFSVYFDEIHANFLKKIKQQYPSLTSTDIKLCAYLKLNLSSKEIAQILHISPKGVEVARYRLRKKLDLDAQANLMDFLNSI